MRSAVKAVYTIVETNENNVRQLNSPFFQGRSDKSGFEHDEVLMIKQMKRFLRKDPPRMSESSIHLVVLIIYNNKKCSHGSVFKNCVDEIGHFLDANKFAKDKTRVAYPVSPDRTLLFLLLMLFLLTLTLPLTLLLLLMLMLVLKLQWGLLAH